MFFIGVCFLSLSWNVIKVQTVPAEVFSFGLIKANADGAFLKIIPGPFRCIGLYEVFILFTSVFRALEREK